MKRAPLPRGRELQVAFILAKAKAACHAIVEMSRDGNTMLLAHRWFRRKGWRRLTRVKLAALRTAIRRGHMSRVEDRVFPARNDGIASLGFVGERANGFR
ncbi:hypothetical protein [Paraburkholderia caledonica]|jgi:hypothetical protein|uniref:hypothetical protein n=1 Tax=Paraburkholderia caledonica TaxID=134536 RepID=UPI0012EC00E1|nr:hypothetical protein [Paraburkholderia caledonica]